MEETFYGKHEIGSVIQQENRWFVCTRNWYISPADSYDAEDANDVFIESGWYSAFIAATDEQVWSHQAKETQRVSDYHAKWDPIAAKIAADAEQKRVKKQAQQYRKMLQQLPLGKRVRNVYIGKLVGRVCQHHETEPKVLVIWDGEEKPAEAFAGCPQWFSFTSLKAL